MTILLQFAERNLRAVRLAGSENVLAACPYHQGTGPVNTPPFWFSITKGVWNCFSCGEKGNLYQLIQFLKLQPELLQNELDFARKSSSEPSKYDPIKPTALARLEDTIPERILGEFDMCPIDLIENDGFLESTLRHFGVGFDVKHERITFPLRDLSGCLVGISGRATNNGSISRYKVYTSEYAAFGVPPGMHVRKGAVLWNADKVYPDAYFKPLDTPLVVVEGFKACMRVWESGHVNVVALLGCAMTEDQLWILQRIGAPVVLMLDRNDAGRKGTRAIGDVLIQYLPVSVCQNYPGEQPSDLIEPEVLVSIESAVPYLHWKLSESAG